MTNRATATATATKLADPMTDAEREDAVAKVTVPETHTRKVLLFGKPVELVPLKMKRQRVLVAKAGEFVKQIQAGAEKMLVVEMLPLVADALVETYCYLGQIYGIEGGGKDWIEDHLDGAEVFEIIQAQFDLQSDNDFLLTGLLGILTSASAARAQADLEARTVRVNRALASSPIPDFSRDSARAGTAPSTSS